MPPRSDHFSRRGPNAGLRFPLSDQERYDLAGLYNEDGAWTRQEAANFLGESRLAVLQAERVIGLQHTEMGRMYQLLARGRISLFHTAADALSLVAQLDRAYLRLVLDGRGWAFEVPDRARNPHYKALDRLFPKLNLKEANTNGAHPKALVGGKLSGGGYSADALAQIASKTKADALYREIDVIIFTPAPRKGQVLAQKHSSMMTLIHALPRADDTQRWTRISRQPTGHRHGNTPSLLPHQAEVLRGRGSRSLPESTLALLQQPRTERVRQAQADLDIDGVISAYQLRRSYGLEPIDLTGRLMTVALIRPVKSRGAVEVQQTLVVSGVDMARLSDNDLNHRLTLTETRLNLGIPADPAVWEVDPRSVLKLNQPDAVWVKPNGMRVAIEADTGQYAMRTVEQKLDSFLQQGYVGTVWSAASEGRGAGIEARFGRPYETNTHTAKWWGQ